MQATGKKSGRSHFLFLDFGSLTLLTAEVKQACPADSPFPDHFDLIDGRGENGENPLNTDAVGDLPDGECFAIGARIAALDDYTLELLDTLLVPFFNFNVDIDGITRTEVRHPGSFFCHPGFHEFNQL